VIVLGPGQFQPHARRAFVWTSVCRRDVAALWPAIDWVKRLPDVVTALNGEVTSLIEKKPAVAIKEKSVTSKPSTKYSRPAGLKEKKLPQQINVRYLYQPRELEGGTKKATNAVW